MLAGQPSSLCFCHTHCPDVCPDPERDTPEILDGYVSWVSDRVTGKPEEIARLVRAWKALGEKVPGAGSDYTMNHTASVFLVNALGRFRRHHRLPGGRGHCPGQDQEAARQICLIT